MLSDAAGKELARSRPYYLRTDPLLDFVAPEAGDYVVRLHDATFAGGRPYRLVISNHPHIENVFPAAVRPGETVTLKPGSDHLMLTQLKHPLETGGTFAATLQFEKAGTVKLEVPVLAMGAAAPGAGAGGGSMMMQGHDHMMMQPGKQ